MQDGPFSLTSLVVKGRPIEIMVVPDHDPLMAHARQLWQQVYGRELGYRQASSAPPWSADAPKGARVMLALEGGRCIATLRMLYGAHSPLDHDYGQWLEVAHTGELTKLMTLREWRKTTLIPHLLAACHQYNALTGNELLYDHVAISAVPRMVPYYRSFGFQRLGPPVWDELHQVWATPMACTRKANRRAVRKLNALLEGSHLAKWEWVLRMAWHRVEMKIQRK